MKKIYMILGNKPFEDKLVEQLSQQYKPAGSSDSTNQIALDEMVKNEVDALIVRESLAESQQAFLEFLSNALLNNKALKIIAITQQRVVGDNIIYQLANIGVYDIISGGTRLADVIMMAGRESKKEDVLTLLNAEQQVSLMASDNSNIPDTHEIGILTEEDISIEITGELPLEEAVSIPGFKDRYMSGITQVYNKSENNEERDEEIAPMVDFIKPTMPSDETLVTIEPAEQNDIIYNKNSNNENEFGFHLPGFCQKEPKVNVKHQEITMNESVVPQFVIKPATVKPIFDKCEAVKTETLKDIVEEREEDVEEDDLLSFQIKSVPAVTKPNVVKTQNISNCKLTLHFVSHCLMSSIAMQYAISRANKSKVVYIETDCRNKPLQLSVEKQCVKYTWVDNTKNIDNVLQNLRNAGYDEIVLNCSDCALIHTLNADKVHFEILQDKSRAEQIKATTNDLKNVRVIVSNFEPDLVSIKSINKLLEHNGLRWANSRIDEYNSRLNSKLLFNEAVNELTKEV